MKQLDLTDGLKALTDSTLSQLLRELPDHSGSILPLTTLERLYRGLTVKSPGLFPTQLDDKPSPTMREWLGKVGITPKVTGYSFCFETLAVIERIMQETQTASVLEFGTGLSTIVLPRLLPKEHRRYISIEENETYAQSVRKQISLIPDYEFVEVATPPITESPKVDLVLDSGRTIRAAHYVNLESEIRHRFGEHEIDIVIVDGPSGRWKWGRWAALIDVMGLLRSGCLILLDDGLRYREMQIARAWSQLPEIKVHGVILCGRGLTVCEVQ